MCQHLHYTGIRNPGIVAIRRTFGGDVPTLTLHGINGVSAGNFHLMDEESTGGIGFCWELPAHRRQIDPRKGIPPRITSLFTRIQAGKIKMRGKSFEQQQFHDQQLEIIYTDNANFFKNSNRKTSLKFKINLIQPY
jgi:hypothetical protein